MEMSVYIPVVMENRVPRLMDRSAIKVKERSFHARWPHQLLTLVVRLTFTSFCVLTNS